MALQYDHCYFYHPHKEAADRPASGLAVMSQYTLRNINILDLTDHISGSVFPALTCEVSMPLNISAWRVVGADISPKKQFITAPSLTINVANLHLRPPVELDGSSWLDTARKTEPIRIAEVKEIFLKTQTIRTDRDSEIPYLHIVAGDFNEGDWGGALTHLVNMGYIDALQRYVPKTKETHTWPFMKNFWTLRKRLDHILWYDGPISLKTDVGRGFECRIKLQCLGCGVITGYESGASDHQPILSRFVIVGNM